MRRSELKRGNSRMKRTRIKPMSKKRRKVNVERAKVVDKLRVLHPTCQWPGCTKPGCDPHEIWTRARASDVEHAITCPKNIRMLCREHHDLCTNGDPRAYRYALVRHSWEGCPCGFEEWKEWDA